MDTTKSDAAACGSYPAPGCSVSYCLMGKRRDGKWVQIGGKFAFRESADAAMADYHAEFIVKGIGGWYGFCLVQETTESEVVLPNPNFQAGGTL